MPSKEDIIKTLATIKELLGNVGQEIDKFEFSTEQIDIQRDLKNIAEIAEGLKSKASPRPWLKLKPHEKALIHGKIVSRYLQAQEEEEVPIKVGIADNIYSMKVINGDEWTLFKNGEQIYATSDNVGPYALAELFLAMMQDWARIEEADGRENPGDLIDKVIFEVLGANLAEMNTVISGDSNDKLKEIIEVITGRPWDQREV